MTKYIFVIFFFLSSLVFSQEYDVFDATSLNYLIPPEQPSIIVKTNPGTILMGPIFFTSEYRVAAEVPVNFHYGVQVAVSYLGKNIFLSLLNKDTTRYGIPTKGTPIVVSGFRVQFTYKRYIFEDLFGNAPYGAYIGLHYSFSKAKLTVDRWNLFREYIYAAFENYDVITGYQFKFLNKITVDLFAGLGYKNNLYGFFKNGAAQGIGYDDIFWDVPLKIVLGFNAGLDF